jgi:tRNA threonylcarbamoyladenosine biosynthesis protein TsaB
MSTDPSDPIDNPARSRPECLLLAIDTAAAGCSVALCRAGAVLAERREEMARGQSERLLPMVAALLLETGVAFEALEALAVTLGPGTFTGVRIGLAAAKGLALALDIPLFGVTCFEVAVAGLSGASDRTVLVALESKRRDLYIQVFPASPCHPRPMLACDPEALAAQLRGVPGESPVVAVGNAAVRAAAALAPRPVIVGPASEHSAAARAGLLALRRCPGNDPPLSPIYLRPPDVTLPKESTLAGAQS